MPKRYEIQYETTDGRILTLSSSTEKQAVVNMEDLKEFNVRIIATNFEASGKKTKRN